MSDIDESALPSEEQQVAHFRRVKTLTEKAMELYTQRVSDFKRNLVAIKDQVSHIISSNEPFLEKMDPSKLLELSSCLDVHFETYDPLFNQFIEYLNRTCTSESLIERVHQLEEDKNFRKEVDRFINELFRLVDINKQASATGFTRRSPSVKSQPRAPRSRASSARSTNSSISSSLLARKQAKAEAAKAQIAFMEKEAEIKRQQSLIAESEKIEAATRARQQADLEIELKLVQEKKQVAAVTAEAEALEHSIGGSRRSMASLRSPRSDTMVKTAEFVQEKKQVAAVTAEAEALEHSIGGSRRSMASLRSLPRSDAMVKTAEFVQGISGAMGRTDPGKKSDPQPQTTKPSTTKPSVCPVSILEPQEERFNVANDLTRFLLRKDLALSRLSQYNDKAETYQAWKGSFSDVVKEMGVSPAEEIDLLIKWLGPDSKRHAVSLRSAYTTDYANGLKKIWERLDDRYGSVESVHHSVMLKLERFPKISVKESAKLYVLADLLSEIDALKQDPKYAVALSYFDSSVGVSPIVQKVPFLQDKWARRAMDYKKHRGVAFPPFEVFADFINDQAKLRNDPGLPLFTAQVASEKKDFSKGRQIFTKKTDVEKPAQKESSLRCPIHKTDHPLDNCRAFKTKSFDERRNFLKQNKLCFKCFNSAHQARDCTKKIKCEVCSSQSHCTVMHLYRPQQNGGENVISSCTEICGRRVNGKSCAKLVLVKVYHQQDPARQVKAYAILDEQSNRSLAKPALFAQLGMDGQDYEYTLNSCSGKLVTKGRRASGCTVEALDGTASHNLPTLIECTDIPDNRDEIPTPQVVQHHEHLSDLENQIPELDEDAQILLLIGRDMSEAHHVLEQRLGPPKSPYAQRLSLGWVVVGEVCLGKTHQPNQVNVNKLYLLNNGRPSYCEPCSSEILVKEKNAAQSEIHDTLFERTKGDEKPGMSVEDQEFIEIMSKDFRKDSDGKWVAPLPFRQPQQRLPNNRQQALKRAKLLDANLRRNPDKMQHFLKFMENIFSNGHAEPAPELKPGEDCCFLPIFGVYNSHKPDQIRAVFDSSAKQDDISLNDVLIHGPDLTNSLLGVLLRFRREPVAIAADIQQMFYSFKVEKKHRNYLRFYWYRDNKPDLPLVEYRMCVHVFGNSPSPAIATYGLRQSVKNHDDDVREFVNKNFYVDDGLTSFPTEIQAIDLLKRTQDALAESGLKLHKIVSNSKDVMRAFPAEDLAKDLKDVNFDSSDLPTQRSLGVTWDLDADAFKFNILLSEKKGTTRRSILSEVNSIFDPLGFLSPVTIEGKLILQDVVSDTAGWDDSVSPMLESRWRSWRETLSQLKDFQIPRTYAPESPGLSYESKLIVFSDASEKAVAASAYLHTRLSGGNDHVGFVIGKAKVAPSRGHTIPRLELCAALLATEIAGTVTEQLEMNMSQVEFFTDSKVILGYIQNRKKRFFTYVSNRVAKIHNRTSPSQWNYVPTNANPADCATRPIRVEDFLASSWLCGPTRLPTTSNNKDDDCNYELVAPEEDKEVRPEVSVKKTTVEKNFAYTFENFSTWTSLIRAISFLKRVIRARKQDKEVTPEAVTLSKQAEDLVIRETQSSALQKEIEMLERRRPVPPSSSIRSLTPFLDDQGVLRLGGRIEKAPMKPSQKHPTTEVAHRFANSPAFP